MREDIASEIVKVLRGKPMSCAIVDDDFRTVHQPVHRPADRDSGRIRHHLGIGASAAGKATQTAGGLLDGCPDRLPIPDFSLEHHRTFIIGR